MTEHRVQSRSAGEYVAAGLGMLLLLAALPFYLSSGLMAPAWAIVLLLIFWAALFALGIWLFRRRPYAVLLLPLVAVAVWFGAMSAGEALLGWQA